jgi:hypothetical protein
MIVREPSADSEVGVLCISQPQHAGISGQIARAWGNEQFPAPMPPAEVCLAAERHDDGMADYDAEPELDPETGLPFGFMRMPLELWLGCWRRGPSLVAERSPLAGVLVSLHGQHLLNFRKIGDDDQAGRAAVEGWRAEQRELRSGWIERARRDPGLADPGAEEAIERARKLIEIWDVMSLAVCMPRLPATLVGVPADPVAAKIEMQQPARPGEAAGGEVLVGLDPWPFAEARVPLSADGRRLPETYEDRASLHAALAKAPLETLSVTLVRSAPG